MEVTAILQTSSSDLTCWCQEHRCRGTVVKEKELRGAAHSTLNVAQRDCKIKKSRGRVRQLKALGSIQYGSRGEKKKGYYSHIAINLHLSESEWQR